MTLKEKITELNPNLISDDFIAGVMGCPHHYFDISCFENCHITPYAEELCRECWNREYIENNQIQVIQMSNPEFYVYYHNFNEDKIETFDVISQIKPFILKNKKHYWDKEQFQKELNAEIMCRYWCKSEWEVIISAWVGGEAECKIDVYQQIKNNWTLFWRMCWEIYTGLE